MKEKYNGAMGKLKGYAKGIGRSIARTALGLAAAGYTAVAGANYASAGNNYPYTTTGEAEAKGNSEETRYGGRFLAPINDKFFIGGEYFSGTKNDGEADIGIGQRIKLGDKDLRFGWNGYVVQRDNNGTGEVAVSPGLEFLTDILKLQGNAYFVNVNRDAQATENEEGIRRELINSYFGGDLNARVCLFNPKNAAAMDALGGLYAFSLPEAEASEILGGKAGARLRFLLGKAGKYGELQFQGLYDKREGDPNNNGGLELMAVFTFPGNMDYDEIRKSFPYLDLREPAPPKPPVELEKPKPRPHRKPKPTNDDHDDEPECSGGHEAN